MKNLKYFTYLFTIFFLFISCENNTKKSDVKETNTSEVNRPTPNNTELEKKSFLLIMEKICFFND